MTAKFQHSQVIDRPIDKVFHFMVNEHVRNHPRWDPQMALEQVSGGPSDILISAATYAAAHMETQVLGQRDLALKGRTDPVHVRVFDGN